MSAEIIGSGENTRFDSSVSRKTLAVLFALSVVGSFLWFLLWLAVDVHVEGQRVEVVQAQQFVSFPVKTTDNWVDLELPRRLCRPTWESCYDVYRVEIRDSLTKPAVYIPAFAGSLLIRVNGQDVLEIGSMHPPISHLKYRPALVELPKPAMTLENNTLELVLTTPARHFFRLNEFYIGELSELKPAWALNQWLSVDVVMLSVGVNVVLGLLSLLVFLQGGRNPLFGWFTGIVVFSTLRSLFFLWQDPNFELLRQLFYYSGSLGALASVLAFSRYLSSGEKPRGNFWLLVLAGISTLTILYFIQQDPYSGNIVADEAVRIVAVIVGIATMISLGRYFSHAWHPVKAWVISLFMAAFILVLHDVIPQVFLQPVEIQMSGLAPLFVVIAFCLIAGQRFSEALTLARNYQVQLTKEVQNKEKQLRRSFEDLSQSLQQQSVLAERERIMRDVHDGVGGRLSGLLMFAKRNKSDRVIVKHLEESLHDLHAIINALDGELENNLRIALANFEARVRPWLDEQGLILVWQIKHCDSISADSPWLLNVYRILQEALNNVVQHAQATEVIVKIEAQNNCVEVTVIDNGCGISGEPGFGHGLKNIRHRVQQVDGQFELVAVSNGFGLRLSLPLSHKHGDRQPGDGSLDLPE